MNPLAPVTRIRIRASLHLERGAPAAGDEVLEQGAPVPDAPVRRVRAGESRSRSSASSRAHEASSPRRVCSRIVHQRAGTKPNGPTGAGLAAPHDAVGEHQSALLGQRAAPCRPGRSRPSRQPRRHPADALRSRSPRPRRRCRRTRAGPRCCSGRCTRSAPRSGPTRAGDAGWRGGSRSADARRRPRSPRPARAGRRARPPRASSRRRRRSRASGARPSSEPRRVEPPPWLEPTPARRL